MVLLDKLWDDVLAGPHPDRGLGKLRKISTHSLSVKAGEGESSKNMMTVPESPTTPATPNTPATPTTAKKENVWRSVFHPGSNLATKNLGGELFDKPMPNSPTVYDWLYSGETKSTHR